MKKTIIFGTDGWRGLIGKDVNNESVAEAAQAFASYLNQLSGTQVKKAAIGYDGRKHSREFAEIFAEVLSGNKIEVYLSDRIIPTPVVSFYTKINKLDSGVMITASHNPAEYNGVKFKASYGGPYFTEETLKVESFLHSQKIKKDRKNIRIENFLPDYLNQIRMHIDLKLISESGIGILIDSMSGAGQNLIEDLLKEYKISCKTIYAAADDNFSGRQAEPIEKNLKPLSDELKTGSWAMGIATDGDADRVGIMDNNGNWVSAQETILLISDYLYNKKNIHGNLVKTSSVTDKLKVFENPERRVIDVQVGFKYICEEMIKGQAALGFEESGGFGYGFHMPERDGILSGLLIAEIVAATGCKELDSVLNELRKNYGEIFYNRLDLNYENDDRLDILPRLFENPPSSVSDYKITDIKEFYSSRGIINGLKLSLTGSSRWLLIRSSETEPLIRIYAEAENNTEVNKILESGKEIIFRSDE